jgi:hypothetical protein
MTVYFRSRDDVRKKTVQILVNGQPVVKKRFARLVPSEMEVLSFEPKTATIESIEVRMD